MGMGDIRGTYRIFIFQVRSVGVTVLYWVQAKREV